MKLPLEWLKAYIDIPLNAKDLAKKLTMSGTAVENITKKDGTDILHLEITTNRPDCLSFLGIAQEVHAVTGKRVKSPVIKQRSLGKKARLPLSIEIQDKKGCPYYTGRAFDGVNVAASPAWVIKNLSWMEQLSINNVVDITNFCLFEQGQPLHAFDYDKVEGAKIIVRRAKKGEKIVAINGIEYSLDERILVIADAKKPIAIAGVMGGLGTEVTSDTKRVILESAQFDLSLIRRAARFLKLGSESSYRFERGVDPRRVRLCSDRASDLFVQYAEAQPATRLVEAGSLKTVKSKFINLRMARVHALLGRTITAERITKILTSLGFKVKRKSKLEFKVKTLIQRADVNSEADLIEEIVRIEGFEKIPEVIPPTTHVSSVVDHSDLTYRRIRDLKKHLVSQGFSETVTFSLLSRDALARSGWSDNEAINAICNPLSREQEILRPTGITGLLNVISHNINRKMKNLAIFETGKCFSKDREDHILSLAITGALNLSWENRTDSSFYYLKGILENCFRVFYKEVPLWQGESSLNSMLSSVVSSACKGRRVALLGEVDNAVLTRLDIAQPVFYAEINLDEFFNTTERKRFFEDLPPYPPVKRDVAFVISEATSVEKIKSLIEQEGGAYLKAINLFDQYKGKNIPKGKRSLAFSLEYQKLDGTFTDEEISRIHEKVRSGLKRDFQVDFRE